MVSAAALCLASATATPLGETEGQPQAQQEQAPTRWQYYNQYTRWSIGANVGLPFFTGNFRSKDYDKLHWGVMADFQAGYQITPLFGLRFTAGYAQGKTGAKSYETEYWLDKFGAGDYRTTPLPDSRQYKDLYSMVRLANFGLNWDINVNNLFRYPRGDRRWTVLVSPGITLQKYFSDVYERDTKEQFSREQHMPWTLSVGADALLRYKVCTAIDLQARLGMDYIHQNKFDGLNLYRPHNHQNFMTHFSLGAVWKIGSKKSNGRQSLLYAKKYVAPPKPRGAIIDTIVVKMEPQIVEKERTVTVEKKIWQPMPVVCFERGSACLDRDKYATELETIYRILSTDAADQPIYVYGYADHYGNETINAKLTQQRAENMRDYLIERGIAPSRFAKVCGMGKDLMKKGEDSYSLKARRVEVAVTDY